MVGWFVGWLVGWLIGWLAGSVALPTWFALICICLACFNCLASLFTLTLDYLGLLDLLAHEDDCYKRAVSLLVGLTMRSYWHGLLCFTRAYACSLCFGLRFFAGSDNLTLLQRCKGFSCKIEVEHDFSGGLSSRVFLNFFLPKIPVLEGVFDFR